MVSGIGVSVIGWDPLILFSLRKGCPKVDDWIKGKARTGTWIGPFLRVKDSRRGRSEGCRQRRGLTSTPPILWPHRCSLVGDSPWLAVRQWRLCVGPWLLWFYRGRGPIHPRKGSKNSFLCYYLPSFTSRQSLVEITRPRSDGRTCSQDTNEGSGSVFEGTGDLPKRSKQ